MDGITLNFIKMDKLTKNKKNVIIDYNHHDRIFQQFGDQYVLEVKNELISKIVNFHKSEIPSLTIDDIPYGVYLKLFSDTKPIDIMLGVKKLPENTIILASVRQRGKVSPYHKETDFTSSTWDYDSVSTGFISWMTQTSIPTIKLNTNTYETHKFLSKWDGESKALLKYKFINNPKSKFWKVLDGLEFTDVVKDFINNPNRFITSLNEKSVNLLREMFFKFQQEQELKTDKKTITEFIDSLWMLDNGYQSLLSDILNLRPTIILQNLPPSVESEAYYREGKHGQKQTDIHLINSQVRDAWYEFTRFDVNSNPKELFYDSLKNSCFVVSKNENPFYRDVNSDIFSSHYGGMDEYIYDFTLSTIMDINSDLCEVYFDKKTRDNNFYRGIARPSDRGTVLVKDNVENYHKVLQNCSSTKKIKIQKDIKNVFQLIEHLFGYDKEGKVSGGSGFKNNLICANHFDYVSNELDLIRTHLRKYGIIRKGALGRFDKLKVNEVEKLITQNTLSYFFENSSKFTNKTQITRLLRDIYNVIYEKWLDYIFSYKVIIKTDNTDTENYVPVYTQEQWDEVKNNTQNLDKPIFGIMYGLHGGNLEKMFYIFDEFWKDEVIPHLTEVYGNLSNTTKEMYHFKRHLISNKGQKFVDGFKMFSVDGRQIYDLNKFDVGHPDAEAKGGVLFHKKWLAEESHHNRYEHTTDSKDLIEYYKCLVANHNDNKNYYKKRYITTESEDDFEMINECNHCMECLKSLLEYLGLSELYSSEYSYENGTVQKESYIND